MNDVICVKTFNTRLEADLAKAALASQGIKAMVCGDDLGGMDVEIVCTSGGIKLVVARSDIRKASRILFPKKT